MDAAGLEILNALFGEEGTPAGFQLLLFTSPATINDTLVFANFEFEEFDTLTLVEMSTSLSAGVPMATWPDKTFTFAGALPGNASIKGYAVASDTNTVWFAELLSQPFTPANNGDKLTVAPRFKLGNGTPT